MMLRERQERGMAAVEFAVIFPALVMMVFGVIQTAFLYQGKATLNHATMLAARAGALHNGDVNEMRNALARGLAPMFAGRASAEGFAEALVKATAETASASKLVSIEVLNPTAGAFKDFGRDRLDGVAGKELPNDTLNYRTTAAGADSKVSVQDANLLHIRVTYCFRLIVPVIDRMLHSAVNSGAGAIAGGMKNPFGIVALPAGTGACANPLFPGLRIYMKSEALVRMQTPFFEANLAGSTKPGETPPPGGASDPEAPPADPTDPDAPIDPGTPPTQPPEGPICL